MKPICHDCIHNLTKDVGGKKCQPIVKNKPKAICWCCHKSKVIDKKYESCEFYRSK